MNSNTLFYIITILNIIYFSKKNKDFKTLSHFFLNKKTSTVELPALQNKLVAFECNGLYDKAIDLGDLKFISGVLEDCSVKDLRIAADNLRNRAKSCVVVLACVEEGKVSLIAAVSADNVSKVKAGDIIRTVAPVIGGKGGGRPDLAQAGGNNPEGITECFNQALALVKGKL